MTNDSQKAAMLRPLKAVTYENNANGYLMLATLPCQLCSLAVTQPCRLSSLVASKQNVPEATECHVKWLQNVLYCMEFTQC